MNVKEVGQMPYYGQVPAGLMSKCSNPKCGALLETEAREPGAQRRNCVIGGQEREGWAAPCIICGHEVFFLVPAERLVPAEPQLAAS